MRVHQVFQNQDGWLVAAPFEYTGETVKSADIASTQQVATGQIPGAYKFMIHKYGLNYTWGNQDTVTPTDITLCSDGTITGAYTGTWEVVEGTSYLNLTIGNTQYKGVMVNQVMESNTTQWPSTTFAVNDKNKTIAFTALAKSGVTVWGYRSGDDPTDINNIERHQFSGGNLFDLQGHRVTTPTGKGIYIQNGRKQIISH